MKKIIVTLCCILCSCRLSAQGLQDHSFFMGRMDRLWIGACSFDTEAETVDSARFTACYEMTYWTSPETTDRTSYRLLCGESKALFVNQARYYADLVYTKKYRGESLTDEEQQQWRQAGTSPALAPAEVLSDRVSGMQEVCYRIPFYDGQVFRYEEPVPDFSWRMLDARDTVAGYACICAEGSYAGRTWRVWFAPEIPAWAGPWKFAGLPGLVLKAEDSAGDYRFECVGLTKCREPIVRYAWPERRATRKKWLQFERNSYLSPYQMFAKGGTVRFFHTPGAGAPAVEIDESWQFPYNPLERE